MCDTYQAVCDEPGCGKTMPFHIANCAVPRTAVHVRCRKHKPPCGQGWWRVTLTAPWPRYVRHFGVYYLLVDCVPDPLAAGHGVNECLDETGEPW